MPRQLSKVLSQILKNFKNIEVIAKCTGPRFNPQDQKEKEKKKSDHLRCSNKIITFHNHHSESVVIEAYSACSRLYDIISPDNHGLVK